MTEYAGRLRLGVNIDHVATVRNARGSAYPDPLRAAQIAEEAGADGITAHLREDRRHISDGDIDGLMETLSLPLNLEMAATDEMQAIALRHKPHAVCIVPEKREERTTEGGLDVAGQLKALTAYVGKLREGGIPTSLFIDPDAAQVKASAAAGAAAIELHTGDYANAPDLATRRKELERLAAAADLSSAEHPELVVAAGHGLTERNVVDLVRLVTPLEELNIGHALVADAVISGLEEAVLRFRAAIDDGESRR